MNLTEAQRAEVRLLLVQANNEHDKLKKLGTAAIIANPTAVKSGISSIVERLVAAVWLLTEEPSDRSIGHGC